MTNLEARKILSDHNEWRRGGDGEATNPVLLGQAIETALDALDEVISSEADDSEE
jgi:hypothetical protein